MSSISEGKIVLLAYRRTNELEKILQSVAKSDLSSYNELIIIQQSNNLEVDAIIKRIDWIPTRHIHVDRESCASSAQAINMNVHQGLTEAFLTSSTSHATVLEDDILVSEDFFRFNTMVINAHSNDSYFRGVNGFSAIPRSETTTSNYGLYRYGYGWGWSITRKTWEELQKIWLGSEDFHWDGLVEPFAKTGFVVMPGMSRILNIGFSDSATHTKPVILDRKDPTELALENSFIDFCNDNSFQSLIVKSADLHWRSDCRPFQSVTSPRTRIIQSLYKSMYLLRINNLTPRPIAYAKGKFNHILDLMINVLSLDSRK